MDGVQKSRNLDYLILEWCLVAICNGIFTTPGTICVLLLEGFPFSSSVKSQKNLNFPADFLNQLTFVTSQTSSLLAECCCFTEY